MLNELDLHLLQSKGITPEKLSAQLESFEKGFPFLKLYAPASVNQGITAIKEADQKKYLFTDDGDHIVEKDAVSHHAAADHEDGQIHPVPLKIHAEDEGQDGDADGQSHCHCQGCEAKEDQALPADQPKQFAEVFFLVREPQLRVGGQDRIEDEIRHQLNHEGRHEEYIVVSLNLFRQMGVDGILGRIADVHVQEKTDKEREAFDAEHPEPFKPDRRTKGVAVIPR